MIRRLVRFLLIAAALGVVSRHADAVQLSMRDTTVVSGDTLRIALLADSIAPVDSVRAYQFTLTFDAAMLAGVGADASGTLGQPWGDPFTSANTLPGELRVAAAGTQPIAGSGPLVTLLLRASSDQGGMTALRLDSMLLNEGWPAANYSDPLATIMILPLAVSSQSGIIRSTEITVSPNPTRGSFRIQLPDEPRTSRVRVWTILGREVCTVENHLNSAEMISLSNAPAGVYFVTVDAHPHWCARVTLLR